MKTQKDIIIARAYDIYIETGTKEADELASQGDRVNYRPMSIENFSDAVYTDKSLDKWINQATSEYNEIVTKNLHREL